MTRGRLAALAGVLFAALLVARASAEEPARLEMRADGTCTAGRTVEVFWSAVGGGQPAAEVRIDGVAREGGSGVALVRCPALRGDWRVWAARYGMAESRYEVRGTALAPDGREVSAQLDIRVRPALPAPAEIAVPSSPRPGLLEIEFRDEGRDDGRIAARWRSLAGGEWRIGPSASGEIRDGISGRHRAEIIAWLDAGIHELQLARVRSAGEIPGLAEADWSESAVLDLSEEPLPVAVEATHDSIIVRSDEGAAIAAHRWILSGPCRGDDGSARHSFQACVVDSQLAADTGELDVVRWDSLVSDSKYGLSWLPAGGSGGRWQYLFQVRTEPAPDGYAPALAATGGKAVEVGARSVSLRWESPPETRHPYRISAYDFGASRAISEVVEEAGAVHDVVLDGLRPGAAYRVEVIRERPDGMEFGTRFIIETLEGDSGAVSADRPGAPIAEYREQRGERVLFTLISATVPDGDRWSELEYEWRFGGRTMRRLSPDALWLRMPLPGVYRIRARGRDGGPWSAWSEFAVVETILETRSLIPTVARGARLRDGVRIEWSPGRRAPASAEYVVRWSIDGGPEAELRGVADRWIILPVTAGRLRVTVAAVHAEFGESEQSFPFEMQLDQPLTAVMSASQWYPCSPGEGAPCPVRLWIQGGTAPFETEVGGHAETVDGSYELEIDYDALADERGIDWEVRDALGATVSGTYHYPLPELDPDTGSSRRLELARLHATLEGEIVAVWHCAPGVSAWFVARWREIGRAHWRYVLKPKKDGLTWVNRGLGISWEHQGCLYPINGLSPGGAYEVGVGTVGHIYSPFDPDAMRWSETWAVTVPVESEGVWVSREEGGARVSWAAQAGVRRYVVVLRGEGRSWWRVHD